MLINIVGIVTVIISVIVTYRWRKLKHIKQDRPPGITFSLVGIIILLFGWFMYYHACSC